jgi:alpha-glucosidase (family GH31 glycosyl hydrolase)
MLGDTILVAPVLREGATSRTVYLPTGTWSDEVLPDHPTYEGPVLIEDYEAPLDVLPYFRLLASSAADQM